MTSFITFDGVEGSGKTTQIRRLAEALRLRGHSVCTTREPGGCPIADAIRSILLDPAHGKMAPRAELLLYAAARAQHVAEVIRPALERGEIVLCDRFTDATIAYQGFGRGLERDLISHLNDLASGGLVPDLTLLLDLPVEEGLRRALERNALDDGMREGRFEQEALAFHNRVREGYHHLAATESRFRVVDALGPEDEVALRVASAAAPVLEEGP